MPIVRKAVVAFGIGLALLDTSPVDAAPVSATARGPSPVPSTQVLRPAVAPLRLPTETFTVAPDGPSAVGVVIRPRTPKPDTTCKASGLALTWPLQGTPGTTWVTHNYTDLDSSSSQKDWKGATGDAAITYDGHKGYDILVGSFREMDSNKVLARAAAPGKVIAVEWGQGDRNTKCLATPWNYVAVQHANGFVTFYGHLKMNSVVVRVGDVVKAGDPLGTVGSSGCSTHPHLHFEVRDCDNNWLDPAKVGGMWSVSPAQHEVSGILDIMLRAGGISSAMQIVNPIGNPLHVSRGKLGIGLSAALKAGDELTFLVMNGASPSVWSWKVTGRYGLRLPSWNIDVHAGQTNIHIWVNDQLKIQRSLMVD
jgi:murein DD-endopeptidase MepM/ murein hydrolase activator NlpD